MVPESKIPVSPPHQKHRDPDLRAVSHEHRHRDFGRIYSIILPFQVVTFGVILIKFLDVYSVLIETAYEVDVRDAHVLETPFI